MARALILAPHVDDRWRSLLADAEGRSMSLSDLRWKDAALAACALAALRVSRDLARSFTTRISDPTRRITDLLECAEEFGRKLPNQAATFIVDELVADHADLRAQDAFEASIRVLRLSLDARPRQIAIRIVGELLAQRIRISDSDDIAPFLSELVSEFGDGILGDALKCASSEDDRMVLRCASFFSGSRVGQKFADELLETVEDILRMSPSAFRDQLLLRLVAAASENGAVDLASVVGSQIVGDAGRLSAREICFSKVARQGRSEFLRMVASEEDLDSLFVAIAVGAEHGIISDAELPLLAEICEHSINIPEWVSAVFSQVGGS